MSTLQLAPYGQGKIAPVRPTPPHDAEEAAVGTVFYEGIGGAETYWLSPATDGQPVYTLWFSFDELPDHVACCGRLSDCDGLTAAQAAETLLEEVWSKRYPAAVSLAGFRRGGLVNKQRLDKLHRRYDDRLTPKKAPRDEPPAQEELDYEDGALKYRGETRGGIPDGQGVGYWENGHVWCDGHFRDGNPHGYCRVYFPDGVLRHEGEFEEGLPFGPGTEYWSHGTVRFEGTFGRQSLYYYYGARVWKEGRLYDERGRLQYEGVFVPSGRSSKPRESA